MYRFHFDDGVDMFSGQSYRHILILNAQNEEISRTNMGKPDDKRDKAWGIIRCAYLNNTPCECGSGALGIKAFCVGHSDWCPVYRSPLVTWDI